MMQIRIATIRTFISLILFSIFSCTEKKTEDANKAFELWAGESPQKGVKVIQGKYWNSSHWSNEYIAYLELRASKLWRKEFIRQNNLIERKETVILPSNAPVWFQPEKSYRTLTESEFSQGSIYYEDPVSGKMFIYEIQL